MRFKQLFCMIAKALIVFCETNFVSLSSCHIIDSYVIFDRIIVLYMCLTLLNVTFHVNAINFVSVNVCFVILSCNFLTCDLHFNFVSICNSRILMSVFEVNCIFFRLIVVCMLNFFELLFKWISSYFVEEKIASWRRDHAVKIIGVDFQRSVDCFHAEDERGFLHSICSSVCFLSMCSRFI